MVSTFRLFMRMNGWVPLIAVAIGMALAGYGGYEISTGKALQAQEISSTATIERKFVTTRQRSGSGGLRNSYQLVLTYNTASGVVKTHANATMAFYNDHQPGDQIEVFYLPDTPETFEFTRGSTLKTGWGAAMTGGLVLLGGLALLGFFFKRAGRAERLLQTGQTVDAKVVELVEMRGGAYLDFVFRLETGGAITGRSLSRASKYFGGIKKGQSIDVIYDPADPSFAFWKQDLT